MNYTWLLVSEKIQGKYINIHLWNLAHMLTQLKRLLSSRCISHISGYLFSDCLWISRHCVLSGRRQHRTPLLPESRNLNMKYFISSSGNWTHNLLRLQSYACITKPRLPHLITIINYMVYINNIPFAGGVLQERSSYHAVCAGSRSPLRALQFYWRGYKCEYK